MFSLAAALAVSTLFGLGLGHPAQDPDDLIKPEKAAALVTACGFANVRVTYDKANIEDVIEVLDVAVVPQEQLSCAARASLDSRYYVIFPAAVEQAYQPIYRHLSRERGKADARAWVKKKGLLARLPTYEPGRSDETTFARNLESLCGPKAAKLLQPMNGEATIRVEGFFTGQVDYETLHCLEKVMKASGYPLVFIGNETDEQAR